MPESPDWEAFYRNTKESPPSPLLLKALAYARPTGKALDLGAGALKDAKHLLRQGFEVTALDIADSLPAMAAAVGSDKLQAVVSTFDAYDYPEGAYDVVTAMYALPFNPPDTFDATFARIKAALAPGGVLACQLFGPDDQWSADTTMTFHARAQVEALLADLETLQLDERQWDGKLASGEPKHWHVFDIIARKP
jgi:SAM-dependent methyltransferase